MAGTLKAVGGAPPEEAEPIQKLTFREKVLKVMEACRSVPKKGQAGRKGGEDEYSFSFRRAEDVIDAANRAFCKYRLIAEPEFEIDVATEVEVEKNGRRSIRHFRRVKVWLIVKDVDTEQWAKWGPDFAEGQDNSDKAVAKAATMALKYLLAHHLLISEGGLDIEADKDSVQTVAVGIRKPEAIKAPPAPAQQTLEDVERAAIQDEAAQQEAKDEVPEIGAFMTLATLGTPKATSRKGVTRYAFKMSDGRWYHSFRKSVWDIVSVLKAGERVAFDVQESAYGHEVLAVTR